MIKTVITHARCVDGFVSAAILAHVHEKADVRRRFHGEPLDIEPGVLFCDIAPPLELAEAFFSLGAVVLDHHKTALPVFGVEGARGVYSAEPGVSGARLALLYAMGRRPTALVRCRPGDDALELGGRLVDLVQLVGVYDTWQQDDKAEFRRAAELHTALEVVMDDEREVGEATLPAILSHLPRYAEMGALLYRQTERRAKDVAKRAVVQAVRGVKVGVIVDTVSTSVLNLASTLIDADVVVSASFDVPKPSERSGLVEDLEGSKIRCSLRSRGGFDCRKAAEAFGGGGHAGAAGFAVHRGPHFRPAQFALDALFGYLSDEA